LTIVAVAALAAACGNPGFSGRQNAKRYLASAVHKALPTRSSSYLGVYEAGVPQSYALLQRFTIAVGHKPNLVLYYSAWGEEFQTQFADEVWNNGAIVIVQINPRRASLQAIASGRYDSYIRAYAIQVRAFGHPVVVGFGHEMNGSWYPWGYHHVTPVVWIAAWRHIVNVFRREGAGNVTWLWTVNIVGRRIPSPQAWWPGAGYVTWIGIDGYYRAASSNFTNVYGPTITAIRRFAKDPILLSEIAIGPRSNPSGQMPALFSAIHARHLLGLVWFDAPASQNWRLETNPAALAAFRHSASSMSPVEVAP
jgi:hypothetical protein